MGGNQGEPHGHATSVKVHYLSERSQTMPSNQVIKINAITVPEDSGDELAERFAARAGAVDGQDGFEGFELLRPTDGRHQWLVVTRWRDQAAFDAWVASPAFAHGHAGAGRPSSHGGPVSTASEIWNYEVAGESTPPTPVTEGAAEPGAEQRG